MKYENFYITNKDDLENWIKFARFNIEEDLKEWNVILNLEVKKVE